MHAPEKIKILIVDDEPSNILAMEAILECLGQELVRAASGAEALRQMLGNDFAVILLDAQMPGMDGFETAELIRQRPRSRFTPIIFVTAAFVSDEMMFKGYSKGAVDYIIKPVVSGILRAKVEVFIELANYQKRLQAEIIERMRIAAEINELNLKLEQKNSELQIANGDLEAFSYSVSHDLRTPLSHIVSYIELVEMGDAILGPEHRDYLAKAREAALRMGELIRDLLNFARVGCTGLQIMQVNLNLLIDQILDQDLRARGRAIEWVIPVLPDVMGDPSLLRQVLSNLLSNAVKYSSTRPVARIEIGSEEDQKEWMFFVRDNGIGFDMAHAQKLFGVFQRFHTQQEFEGTGIGLANVRRIVQKHGGRTWATGKVNEGSTFFFSLPKSAQG